MLKWLKRRLNGVGKGADLGVSPVAVLIIDMQSASVQALVPSDRRLLVKSHLELIGRCAKCDIPVVILEYGSEYADGTIRELLAAVEKVRRYSFFIRFEDDDFSNGELFATLQSWGTSHLILAGVNADTHVRAAAEGARKRGFKIATAADLIANDRGKPIDECWYKKNGEYGSHWKPVLRKLLAE